MSSVPRPKRVARALGLDPGIARTGFAVLESHGATLRPLTYGLLSTPTTKTHSKRLYMIERQLEKIITKFRPTHIGVERLYFSKNVSTAFAVGHARGVMLLLAARHGIEPMEFSPQEIKQTVTGYGNAEKGQVQRMVRALLCLKTIPKPDDVADALAVAYTTVTHLPWQNR